MKSVRMLVKERDVRLRALVVVLAIVGIFLVLGHVHAQGAPNPSPPPAAKGSGTFEGFGDWVVTQVGRMMGYIIQMLASLVIIITNILINIAQYNDFVKSQPVSIGWSLVRDVVNMFFIIVLLVSAFSTIIGYREFHYKQVLPKLLLMAVLINFSKTLVGLMIDFSQVVMLTFVSAFAQAAAGNFVVALKLTQVTKINPDTFGTGKSGDLGALIAAGMLAILMLGATLTLVLIMTMFLIVRIVGLWMLLIFSPMAFFALALPGKLQKGVSAFVSDWWSKLGTFLIAGPVMAFFLWLTLAVVQGSPNEAFGSVIAGASSTEEVNRVTKSAHFITKVGDAENIATYLVAFVMMLEGVSFAVKSSSAVSGKFGALAGGLAAGGGVLGIAAKGAARVGRTGVTATRYGAKKIGGAAFEGLDYATDIRGKVGRAGLKVAGRLPGAVGAETFGRLAGHRRQVQRERGERQKKLTAGLTSEEQLNFLQGRAKSINRNEATAAQMNIANVASSKGGLKALQAKQEESLAWIADPEERKLKATAFAQQDAARAMKAGVTAAEASGDDKMAETLNEKYKKDPSLYADIGDLRKMQSSGNFKKDIGALSDDAFKDSRVISRLGEMHGFIDGEGNVDRDNEVVKYIQEKVGGNRAAFLDEQLKAFEARPDAARAERAGLQEGADETALRLAQVHRGYVSKDSKGQVRHEFLSEGAHSAGPATVAPAVANRTQAVARVAELAQRGFAPNTAESIDAQVSSISAGAPLAQTSGFNSKVGEFSSGAHRQAFADVARYTDQDLQSEDTEDTERALSLIEGLDITGLKSNADGHNEARSTLLSSVSPVAMRKGYEKASAGNRTKAQKKIREVANLYRSEGARLKGALGGGVSVDAIASLVSAPQDATNNTLKQKMIEKFGSEERALEAGKIIVSANEINTGEQFRALRQELDPRAARRAGGGRTT
ncbi:MAG: hypothetical protein NUV81_00780 [bacterium]|nr:hypothetical protein [bacterium]